MAWHPLGWSPAWFAEIEPFPSAVLAHHYPDVPNLGDMTTIAARVASGEIEAPDVLVGGTPCQAFSVAGLRGGLSDARGQLTLSYVELANAIDAARAVRGDQPAIIVWENVPGVLSSKDNAFGCFLGALAGEDCELKPPGRKWSNAGCVFGPQRAVAWRVADAQYFGVAQRRRRVFVVASARDGFDPASVLFEFDGLRRDSAPSRKSGQGFAADVAPSLVSSGRGTERIGETRGQDPVVAVPAEGCWWDGGQVSQTLDAVLSKGQTMPEKNRFPAVLQPVAFQSSQSGVRISDTHATLDANNGPRRHNGVLAFSCKDYGADAQEEISPTLRAMGHSGSHANAGGQVAIAFDSRQDPVSSEHVFGALNSSSPQAQAVAFDVKGGLAPHGSARVSDSAFPLKASDHKDPQVVCVTGDVTHTLRAEGFDASEDGTGRGQPIVAAYAFQPRIARNGRGDMGDLVSALNAQSGETGKGDAAPCVALAFDTTQITSPVNYSNPKPGDPCHPLAAGAHPPAIAFQDRFRGDDGRGYDRPPPISADQVGTLETVKPWNVATSMAVRRLMPVECERLQGFPDGYTRIPMREYAKRTVTKLRPEDMWEMVDGAWWLMSADGPRYKALGNSMAVPCMHWIGARIDAAVRGAV